MYPTVVLVVRLVLVLAVALVSAGADTYDCIHWGYFQHTLAEHLALLLVVIHEDYFSRVDTTVSLLGGEAFCIIIGSVFLTWMPLNIKITYFDLVCYPKESHFHTS